MMASADAEKNALRGKRILLVVSGGIAAYKALDLTRGLRRAGATVLPVMTKSAHHFITPLSFSALAGNPVRTELFDESSDSSDSSHRGAGTQFGHIDMARRADVILTAPASAGRIAAYAAGLAQDLAGALMLARDVPALLAPAMNPAMWRNPALQRALGLLREDGVGILGPEEGEMACGETGSGRMAEPENLIAALQDFFAGGQAKTQDGKPGALSGLRALVTSGPTREAIDPVRYLTNRSSGRQGRAIARALAAAGAETILITGPDGGGGEANMQCCEVESARDMLEAVKAALPADIAVCAAAVSDWCAQKARQQKWKKNGSAPSLDLRVNPDILSHLSRKDKLRPKLVIGFAAETENLLANAREKLRVKGCDWILANDISPQSGILGGEENEIHFLSARGAEPWPRMGKAEVAAKLTRRIAHALERG